MNWKKTITILLILAMVVNLALALVIEIQKTAADRESDEVGKCFVNGSGCLKVQTSHEASIFFGISNPVIGTVMFAVMALLLGSLIDRSNKKVNLIAKGLAVTMILAALFSIWLLYVQFFVLYTTCIYCLWVDGIMIISTIIYIWVYWKEIRSKL